MNGQKVKCISRGGYGSMREGEIGLLVEIQPPYHEPNLGGFTWPEYWIVKTNSGEIVAGHKHRFEKV